MQNLCQFSFGVTKPYVEHIPNCNRFHKGEAPCSTGDEAALVKAGHCVIHQKAGNSAETQVELFLYFILWYVPQYYGIVNTD